MRERAREGIDGRAEVRRDPSVASRRGQGVHDEVPQEEHEAHGGEDGEFDDETRHEVHDDEEDDAQLRLEDGRGRRTSDEGTTRGWGRTDGCDARGFSREDEARTHLLLNFARRPSPRRWYVTLGSLRLRDARTASSDMRCARGHSRVLSASTTRPRLLVGVEKLAGADCSNL